MSSQNNLRSDVEKSDANKPLGQVIAFVSAKGGTGKTILSATAANLLTQSGMRVVTIDADFSTRGLSLYLLGNVLRFRDLNVKKENCLADAILNGIAVQEVKPLIIEHEAFSYNVVISNSDVWKGGVPEESFLGGLSSTEKQTDPVEYFRYLRKLCDRFRQEYDYVIIDTRGGYDFTSAAPAIVSDGFVVVIEADKISLEQVDGFLKKIQQFAGSLKSSGLIDVPPASLKGFIVNKAIFSVDDRVFPEELARSHNSKTFGVIPVDKEVIRIYQRKEFVFEKAPDSDFSYFALKAQDNLISPLLNWTSGNSKERFEKVSSNIKRLWLARKRAEWIQTLIAPALLVLVIVSTIAYFFFKKGVTQYALPTFYVTMAIFVLASILGSILSSLTALRKLEISKTKRQGATFVLAAVLVGLAYLSVFDIPKTFSRNTYLERIKLTEETLNTEREKLRATQQELSNAQAQVALLTTESNNAQAAYMEAQKKHDQLQATLLTAQQQISTLTITQRQDQANLANAQLQINSMKQEIMTLRSFPPPQHASPPASGITSVDARSSRISKPRRGKAKTPNKANSNNR